MNAKQMTIIAIFTVLIIICSLISIPSVVPFTLQTLAIFMALLLLGPKHAFFSILCYILLGAIGLPVFANAKGGLGALLGNTGGYIIGFLIMCPIYAIFDKNKILRIIGLILGLLALYIFGTAWFMLFYTKTKGAIALSTVLSWTILPFIIPDLAKMLVAYLLAMRIKPAIRKLL